SVPWKVATQSFVPFGEVYPSKLVLEPGASATVYVGAQTPDQAGDASGSIVFSASSGGHDAVLGPQRNSIPVTLRSLVNLRDGGSFEGAITGGNGRSGPSEVAYYQFHVERGHANLTAALTVANEAATQMGMYLVNPDGDVVGYGQNAIGTDHSKSLIASTLNPAAGTWTLIVDFASIVGDQVTQSFKGAI